MRGVRVPGPASSTRRRRGLSVISITITVTVGLMATAVLASAVAAGPALAGTGPAGSASAERVLAPQSVRGPAASGRALIRASKARPSEARSAPHQLGPEVADGRGRPLPAAWPHPAAIAATAGRVPDAVTDSLPSANWAGYEDAGQGAQFTEVTASWVVPTVSQDNFGDSSTWIGIDGISSHNDLIQAGTDQSSSPSGLLYYAWYELLPDASLELGTVFPGDHITAKIDQTSVGHWTISVDDLTQGQVWTEPVTYSAPGTSAEWVEEAPTLSTDNSIETLANFGTVQFSNLAVEGPGTSSATGSPIYMVNNSSQIIAYPTEYDPGTDSFNVVYGTLSSPPSGGQVGPPIAPTTTSASPTTASSGPAQLPGQGLWLTGKDGGIFAFGDAKFHGSTGHIPLQRPITGMAPTADHGGYWLVASDGGIFAFGDAAFAGSVPASGIAPVGSKSPHHLEAPIVGIVPTINGKGYLMVASDGGVFAFGNARFVGSCATIGGCPAPVVAVVPDATGDGYWLLLANCDMVAFGDALKVADTNCENLARANKLTATSAARTPSGRGYWVLLNNGTVFPEGDAQSLGSWHAGDMASTNDPAVSIVPTSDGRGAWVVDANGMVDAYGDAPKVAGLTGMALSAPIAAAAGW
jgi:hypothetical protein